MIGEIPGLAVRGSWVRYSSWVVRYWGFVSPLQGLLSFCGHRTQGVALGWLVDAPLGLVSRVDRQFCPEGAAQVSNALGWLVDAPLGLGGAIDRQSVHAAAALRARARLGLEDGLTGSCPEGATQVSPGQRPG